jgi:hypothetical protein
MERRATMHRHVKNHNARRVWVWNYIPPRSDIDQASKLQYQTSDMLEHQDPLRTCPVFCNNSAPNIHCYKRVYDPTAYVLEDASSSMRFSPKSI